MSQNIIALFVKLLKFGTTGVASLVTSVIFLHILTEYFGIWYILSAILAFFPAFAVSFFLQKYWTFQEGSPENLKKQMIKHLVIITFGLGVNVALLAFFVEIIGLHYAIGQILSGLTIAAYNFPLYRYLVFVDK